MTDEPNDAETQPDETPEEQPAEPSTESSANGAENGESFKSPLDLPPAPDPQATENGLRAFDALRLWLEDDGWYPSQLGDRSIFGVRFAGKNGDMHCFAQIIPDLELFLFYVVAPVKVPEEIRPAVAEFITRANYGMRIGNFEMDYRDGEVRYKSSLDFEGEMLSDNWIKHAVYPAAQTMDRYLHGLMRVIYGVMTPFEAIEEIEN
ncbi:MAG: YbjN domain-containing protein [Chloroflexi bacterium]|nr:YbjN domain-containing protein [Chloroflexota bacterium]